MSNYALIKDGIVVNIVIWNGESDLFREYTTINVDNIDVGIGWSYAEGQFTAPPEQPITT
ncbi:hypothetical protein ACNDTH_000348 [Escherichia coli]|nr:hypothetical protein [Escherichia fergusonii]EHV2968098.1 hypothetical protein [Escherichia coli]EHY3706218.1 hypothetical protein [Escherichia coli]EIN4505398.1 hypothetical protein [Escherichia coli]EKE4303530.1 hypothetical protein [Escherichia coli]